MKIGVVVNPNSGKGNIDEDLLETFALQVKDHELYCSKSTFIHIKDHLITKVIGSKTIYEDCRDSITAGRELSRVGVDCIIFFGGDGTAGDIIFGMKQEGKLIPLAGVATGTACCGPFIAFRSVEDLINFDFTKIVSVWVGGLDVYYKQKLLGTAFIDVVIGDTLLSTVDGQKQTVDASKFFHLQERIVKNPGYIKLSDSTVIVNKKNLSLGETVSQIIVSPFSDKEKKTYISKAVCGLFCQLPYSQNSYGMIISSEPIIFIEDILEPYCSDLKQIIFGKNDQICISKFNAFCIIDGNPKINLIESKVCIKGKEHSALTIKVGDSNDAI